jgi:DNA-binding MarR family transcriptional regulator
MMKMANIRDIQAIIGKLDELLCKVDDDSDNASLEERDGESLVRVNAQAIHDDSLNDDDLDALVALSLRADCKTGETPLLVTIPEYNLKKLERRGYVRSIFSNRRNKKYKLCDRNNLRTFSHVVRSVLEDESYPFYEQLVYFSLCCLSNNSGQVISYNIPEIANVARCSAYEVQCALRSLEKRGLISIYHNAGHMNSYMIKNVFPEEDS